MPILELNEIKKSFGATVALDGVNLSLLKGEVHALIGENGAGKSTLMNILSGSLRADSGMIKRNGIRYLPNNALNARRNGIALIHQELSLAPHLTVTENILLGMEVARFGWLDRKAMKKEALKSLQIFDHSDLHPETIVGKLPIASQQVVEICRAIAARAEIILMDEPTSSLQREDVKRLFELIRKLKNEGVSIIYISHFLEEIREIADSFTVLRDGKSVANGKISETTDDFLISNMVGRSIENLFPHRQKKTVGEVILKVENLSFSPMLKSASLDLRKGEILGIAGLMGSGRTEFVKAIYGLENAESGKISLGNQTVSTAKNNPSFSLKKGIGYLSEDRKGEGLALTLSIADNLTMTNYALCSQFGFLNLAKQKSQSESVINEIGIKTPTATQAVSTLSGGNQQKVAIGRLVHQNAEIFLFDEPTRGIDIGSKSQVYETIAKLAGDGKAILFVSSYLPELFGMCDRLAVMSRGILSETLPIDKWTPESVIQTAIGGSET